MDLRDLYRPLQPTVRQTGGTVSYRELLPAPALQPWVYCYWQLKTDQPLQTPFTYRVVADGCIDIFFEPGKANENFVMGFCKRFVAFELGTAFQYIGIRFLPTAFPRLFNIDAAALSNRYEALHNVLPQVATAIENEFGGNETLEQAAAVLNALLARLQPQTEALDKRFFDALNLILHKQGVLNVQTELDTGLSARQLRRLFLFYVGDTAKTFSRVVRFQNILRAKPSVQSLHANKLFFDAGYYDQAHFIKEFRNFYGVTPGQAFGRE
jgi:AraC-like DNA-binding protein